jgi:chromate transporter
MHVTEVEIALPPPSVSTLQIGWIFLKTGMIAFGGLGATLAVIHRELVDRRQLLTAGQMTEALTFTKPLPGATAFQVVSYLGFRLGGWPGSAMAAVCFVLPPMVGMVLLASLFGVVQRFPAFSSFLNGLVAVVVGLLLATTYRLGRANMKGLVSLLIASAALVAAIQFRINGALIVLVGGLFGLLVFLPAEREVDRKTQG